MVDDARPVTMTLDMMPLLDMVAVVVATVLCIRGCGQAER
jgi:hypothetical protein